MIKKVIFPDAYANNKNTVNYACYTKEADLSVTMM